MRVAIAPLSKLKDSKPVVDVKSATFKLPSSLIYSISRIVEVPRIAYFCFQFRKTLS
jgi:hypothetical protein